MKKNNQIRLFFFPYAGANKYAYRVLEKELTDEIISHPLELPGRGMRFGEKLITHLDEGVSDIFAQMKPFLLQPYAIFGHSLGAVLGYLVSEKIFTAGIPSPVHLFCSGRISLWNQQPDRWYSLPGEEFWNKIIELGGIPQPTSMNNELMAVFEPILRADFQMIQRNESQNAPESHHIDVPITLFFGRHDQITQGEFTWHRNTVSTPSVFYFDGGHFFFLEHCRSIAEIIERTLNEN